MQQKKFNKKYQKGGAKPPFFSLKYIRRNQGGYK